MSQGDLFAQESKQPAAQRHSETSRAAAASLRNVASMEKRVLRILELRGRDGATDAELEEWTGLGGSPVRPRRVNLVHAGLVRDSGGKRKTKSGRSATVWVATA